MCVEGDTPGKRASLPQPVLKRRNTVNNCNNNNIIIIIIIIVYNVGKKLEVKTEL